VFGLSHREKDGLIVCKVVYVLIGVDAAAWFIVHLASFLKGYVVLGERLAGRRRGPTLRRSYTARFLF
jgi:hypothetical protein